MLYPLPVPTRRGGTIGLDFLELPTANPAWKLRLGVNNDYNSKPGKGVDKMDTGYFTRLVLNWK